MNHRSRGRMRSSTSFVGAVVATLVLSSVLSPALASWTVISILGREGDVHAWLALTAAYTFLLVALGGLCSYHLAAAVRKRG